MVVKGGPKIVSDGLVFNLDAAGAVSDKGYDPEGLRIEYLIVAGGGGGGGWSTAGGGGAGGLLQSVTKFSAGTYTVTVGAGGTRGDNGSSRKGSNGGNSQFGASLIAYGGGGGGANTGDFNGLNGGSGGGGFQGSGATGIGGSGVADQGNNGGNGGGSWRSGSGGGAGAAGTPGVGGYGSARGGIGKISRIDFNREYYAGGGASGGCTNGDNSGGLGGGGNGGRTNTDGTNGQTNRGGGGGGGGCYNTRATFGGNGGSGIVMIRYRGKQKATGGDSIVYKNGYTIHTFTSSGSFVLDEAVDGLSTSKIVGTLNNMGPSDYSTGNKGYFSFDGTNQSITFNHPTGQSDGVTHEILIRLNETTQNGILTFNNGGSVLSGLSIVANRFIIYLSGSNYSYFWGFPTLSTGIWYHVVFYLGSGNAADAKGYVDGVLATTIPTNHTGTAYFPTTMYVASTTNTSYLDCDVAFVRCYNRELLIEEIQDNYNATKGRFGL